MSLLSSQKNNVASLPLASGHVLLYYVMLSMLMLHHMMLTAVAPQVLMPCAQTGNIFNLPNMQSASFISQICGQTGISKRSLARLADTHQSMIVRYDAGTHGLPAKAFPALLQLQQQLIICEQPDAPQPSAEDMKALKEQAAWCLAQCYPLRKKLAAMQKLYAQGATTLELLSAHYNTVQADAKLQRWVEQQHYEASKKVEENGWAAQFEITKAITLLEQEAEIC